MTYSQHVQVCDEVASRNKIQELVKSETFPDLQCTEYR